MVAKGMQEHGTSMRRLAKQFRVTEGAVRYRLKKLEEGLREDGRAKQTTALDDYAAAVGVIQEELEDGRLTGEGRPCQVQLIYEILVRDHGYAGSSWLRCVHVGVHVALRKPRETCLSSSQG